MKHTRKKLANIVEELLTYCDSMDATEISFKIEHGDNAHHIYLTTNFSEEYAPNFPMLTKLLNKGRRPDLEETYWTLTGTSDMEDEMQMTLIGAMIDKAEIAMEDNILRLHLTRNRDH